jgi:hypothetical protein
MPEKKSSESDAIMRLTRANIHLATGVARAAAAGLDNFAKKLEHDNLFVRDVSRNGFVLGAIEGWVTALFEGAQLMDQAFTMWRNDMSMEQPPKKPARK